MCTKCKIRIILPAKVDCTGLCFHHIKCRIKWSKSFFFFQNKHTLNIHYICICVTHTYSIYCVYIIYMCIRELPIKLPQHASFCPDKAMDSEVPASTSGTAWLSASYLAWARKFHSWSVAKWHLVLFSFREGSHLSLRAWTMYLCDTNTFSWN